MKRMYCCLSLLLCLAGCQVSAPASAGPPPSVATVESTPSPERAPASETPSEPPEEEPPEPTCADAIHIFQWGRYTERALVPIADTGENWPDEILGDLLAELPYYRLASVQRDSPDYYRARYDLIFEKAPYEGRDRAEADSILYPLDNAWRTICLYELAKYNKPITEVYLRDTEGNPLSFPCRNEDSVWTIPTGLPFSGIPEDADRRRGQVPFVLDPYRPQFAQDACDPRVMDALSREAGEFILSVMPNTYIDYTALSFDDPREADMEFLKRAAFRNAPSFSYPFVDDSPAVQTPPELIPLIDMASLSIVLREHLESTARELFGPEVTVEHGSLGGKTWGYNALLGTYSHAPMGTGDGYLGGECPVLLSCQATGNTVTCVISFYYSGVGGISIALSDGAGSLLFDSQDFVTLSDMDPAEAEAIWEAIRGKAPRGEVTLTRRPGGGFYFTGYRYLGYPG